MSDLFGSKCKDQGIVIYADPNKKVLSESFKLWCRKLDGLTPMHFKIGMKELENRAKDTYKDGGQMWPPSYAEFLGLTENTKQACHKVFFKKPLQVEDLNEKQKRKKRGLYHCDRLKSIFD